MMCGRQKNPAKNLKKGVDKSSDLWYYSFRSQAKATAKADGEWCNGNTLGSDPVIQGSNPCSPAIFASVV